MGKTEYLSEENYKKMKNKISIIGKTIVAVLWTIGLGLIIIGVSNVIKYSDKEILKLEEEKLIKIQEEIEIKIKPTTDEIKKLERVEFTGFDEEYYARKDRIEELQKSIKKETKQLYMIENVLEDGSKCSWSDYREDETVNTYCAYRKIDDMKYIPFIIGGFFISFLAFGVTIMVFTTLNRRKIMAYGMQDMRPLAEEGIEKMAPTAGVAAKEIAKGIKEGLKDEEK